MKALASSSSVCTEEDRNLEAAAYEKLKSLGSQCRIASVFTPNTGTGTVRGVAFRGAPIVIEQPLPFTVDELVKPHISTARPLRARAKRNGQGKPDTCR